jgi:DNA-binding LacI/PurR family transcriptional regulator
MMKDSLPINQLPQKTSLVAQTTAVILNEIESRRWTGWLPGEHELCARLHVSRKTLRAALLELSRKGVIKCSQGRRREIVKRPALPSRSNRVVVLLSVPLQSLNLLAVLLIDHLREHLMKAGYVLEIHESRMPYRAEGKHALESLSETLRPAGWLLLQSTQAMQEWFGVRGLPCLVIGSRYEGINLPSLDRDHAAVCQHAVNQFLWRGHKHLALLTPSPPAAGDVITVDSFREMVAQTKVANVTGTVQEHDCTVANICAKVDDLLSRPKPPTALLVSRARHVLTVLSHLLNSGVQVPKDVALISRDVDSFIEDVVPGVARYSYSEDLFTSKVSRLVMGILQGHVRIKDYKIMPNFIKGRTLG